MANDAELKLVFNHVDIKAQDPGALSRAQWAQNRRQNAATITQYNARKDIKQSQLGLTYTQQLNPNHSLLLSGYVGQRHNKQYLAIPRATQTRSSGHAGGVIDLTRTYYGLDSRWQYQNDAQTLKYSLGVNYDEVREDRQGYENFVGSNLGVRGNLRRDEDNRIFNLDPYMQLQWRPSEKWTFDGGLRYSTVQFRSKDHYLSNGDDSGKARYHQWLPSAGVSYRLAPQTSLYAAYSRGFETATLLEMSYRPDGVGGLNFALQPLTSHNYEAGVKHRLLGGLLTAALYRTDTDNDIVSAGTVDGRATYRNAGKTKRQGFELGWQGKLYKDLNLTLSYNYIDAKFDESNGSIVKGRRIPGIARQTAYAALGWQPQQGLRGGFDIQYSDKVYVDNANSEYAPSYTTVGAYMGYRWQKNHWVIDATARVDNLFDRDYAATVILNDNNGRYYEPSLPRNYTFGLNVSYRF
ncbi:TonB-dependent receptor [Neisseria perflava]|uniref:TonB-dependent receptor n=1 Tax=Neisseria perflava TaxID=33053 RepID=UPI0020A072D0|nr:TonB-dependent receptor [Neisseria perflava]MCP1661246.1 iron complex outermembrane receptor protein [Neisseria perflava]